eukprot:TRINITY_DN6032_c2_g2_i1.p1 TRINITY_DN6032_c2_g2~~TRINITY_DN6032_c2_g2_i1.p1  ORF type:complete len:429 (-),score=12.54 TRINITY_DN6032_c2_g2_i1:305-1591(-)
MDDQSSLTNNYSYQTSPQIQPVGQHSLSKRGGGRYETKQDYHSPRSTLGQLCVSDGETFAQDKSTFATQLVNLVLFVLGFYLYYMTSKHLYAYLQYNGKTTAILSIVLGLIGVLGSGTKSLLLKSLFMVGLTGSAMLTFEYCSDLDRGVRIDCTFAELYLRIFHIEQTMGSIRHDELITQMFSRLHQLDDMMDLMHFSTVHHVQLATKQKSLKEQDAKLIETKISELLIHAEHSYRSLMEEYQNMQEDLGQGKEVIKERYKKQQQLKLQIETIIDTIQSKRVRDQQISIQQYDMFLESLVEHIDRDELQRFQQQLPQLRNALERQRLNNYMAVDVDQHLLKIQNTKQQQASNSQQFKQQFENVLSLHDGSNGEKFLQGVHKSLQELPEHCLKEMEWMTRIYWSTWGILICLGFNIYLQVTLQVIQLTR